jgi:hypothetical protein
MPSRRMWRSELTSLVLAIRTLGLLVEARARSVSVSFRGAISARQEHPPGMAEAESLSRLAPPLW